MPLGTPGRVRSPCLVVPLSCSLRGPQPLVLRLPESTRGTLFQHPIFNTDLYQKVSKWEPQNSPKSQKSAKTHHQNAPTVKTCKKTLSGRSQTSEIYDPCTLSAVFSEAQGSQKGVKMEAKMEPQGTQHHTNQEKRALKKHETNNTAKTCYLLHFDLKRD